MLGRRFRLAYTREHATQILEHLPDLIRITEEAAPIRTQQYKLVEHDRDFMPRGETGWERALWAEYGGGRANAARSPLLPGHCDFIVSYQVMLRGANEPHRGWGEVDLLGVAPQTRLPVVIELKAEQGKDTPLRAIVEASAYAIAIRKAWPHRLKDDWRRELCRYVTECDFSPLLERITVMVAAPKRYWERCIGEPHRRTKGRVPPEAWPLIQQLIRRLSGAGIDIVCASLRAATEGKRGPEQITAAIQDLAGTHELVT